MKISINLGYYLNENFVIEDIYFLIGEICIPIGLIFALLLTYEYNPEENKQENSKTENNEEKLIKDQQENSPSESKEEKLVSPLISNK